MYESDSLMDSISSRKIDHIELALRDESQGPHTTWFEDVFFVHNALPELSIDDISIETEFLGYRLRAPIVISGMTGGAPEVLEINKRLAELAAEFGIAIGVGSQRASLINRDLVNTYKIVREIARNVPVIANIGGAQLVKLRREDIEFVIYSIEADALAVHLNPAQELVQLEGDRNFKGVVDGISRILEWIDVPVIVKEVGTGLSREVALLLLERGIRIFDVAGAGGTNWITIEIMRAEARGLKDRAVIARPFIYWGIPTAASIIEVRSVARTATIIGSGGIRTGIDVAKAIALGADLVGIAQPILKAIMESRGREYLSMVLEQLRMAMLLLGVKNIVELSDAPIVILGKLAQWICARKLWLRNKRAFISC